MWGCAWARGLACPPRPGLACPHGPTACAVGIQANPDGHHNNKAAEHNTNKRESLSDSTSPGRDRPSAFLFFLHCARAFKCVGAKKRKRRPRAETKRSGAGAGALAACVSLVCGPMPRKPTNPPTEDTGVPLFRIGERTYYVK